MPFPVVATGILGIWEFGPCFCDRRRKDKGKREKEKGKREKGGSQTQTKKKGKGKGKGIHVGKKHRCVRHLSSTKKS